MIGYSYLFTYIANEEPGSIVVPKLQLLKIKREG